MGIWGTFISLGIGIGQSLGSFIEQTWGMTNLFMISSITAALSGILFEFVNETSKSVKPFKFNYLVIKWRDIIEPTVLPSAIVMFLSAMCSGIIFVLTPDLSGYLGITNKGFFFGTYVVSTIIIRLLTGSLSDRIGRRKALLIAISMLMLSMILIAFASGVTSYIISSVVFGLATGMSSPTLFAWTADLSPSDRIGTGTGTLFIALEFGIMAGALSTLLTYQNTFDSMKYGFLFGSGTSLICIFYLLWHLKYRHSGT